jgi:hypothetical protein
VRSYKSLQGICLPLILAFALAPGSVFGQEASSVEPPAQEVVVKEIEWRDSTDEQQVSDQKVLLIQQKTKELLLDEIDLFGAFEVDDLKAGDYRKLFLGQISTNIVLVSEGEYRVRATLEDSEKKPHDVDIYVMEFAEGDYEIVDAIFLKDKAPATLVERPS